MKIAICTKYLINLSRMVNKSSPPVAEVEDLLCRLGSCCSTTPDFVREIGWLLVGVRLAFLK